MSRISLSLLLLSSLLFSSCTEVNTTEPEEVYKHWSGMSAPENIELIQGQYWESAHFTKEYEMYLILKSSKEWNREFIEINKLVEEGEEWKRPGDAPTWFQPPESAVMYRERSGTSDQGSRIFRDVHTGITYIYAIQL